MKQILQNMKKNTTKTGNVGESVAVEYLQNCGYKILDRNYWQKWGEIDVVAEKEGKVHFVEVKAVTHETKAQLEWAVTHETWQPEEQVHKFKLHQIEKALETWISEHKYKGKWQIDVIAVRLVPHETYAIINMLENVTEA